MSYYIIRNTKTLEVLPVAKQRNKTSAKLSKAEPPRLFSSKGAAKQALDWWLRGYCYATYTPINVSWSYSEDFDIIEKKQDNRIKEDMEILEVCLVFTKEINQAAVFGVKSNAIP